VLKVLVVVFGFCVVNSSRLHRRCVAGVKSPQGHAGGRTVEADAILREAFAHVHREGLFFGVNCLCEVPNAHRPHLDSFVRLRFSANRTVANIIQRLKAVAMNLLFE